MQMTIRPRICSRKPTEGASHLPHEQELLLTFSVAFRESFRGSLIKETV